MSLSAELEALHADIPGCRTLLFGDLTTETVLRALPPGAKTQEAHDAVFAVVCRAMRYGSAATGGGDPPHVTKILQVTDDGICLARRGGDGGGDLLVVTLPVHPASASEMLTEALRIADVACHALLSRND